MKWPTVGNEQDKPSMGGWKGENMIDSLLKFIADKFEEWTDKSKPTDVADKVTKTGSITVNSLLCNVKGDTLNISGQFAMGGAMATGLTLEMFQVDSSLAPENDAFMTPLATYTNKGEVSMAYQRGKIYLHNEGSQIVQGTAIAFSGSWTVGGGQYLKSLLHSFLGRRWRHVCEC